MTDRTRRGRGDGTVHQRADMDTNTEGENVTLTEFLLARITEDESGARRLLRYAQENELSCAEPKMLGRHIPGWHEWPDVQAMCARVLADCEAKRRIVDLHKSRHASPSCRECGGFTASTSEVAGVVHHGYLTPWPCPTIQLLALPYADHPDYRQEWKP